MAWIELSINTTHEAVDWVRTLLATTEYTGDITLTEYCRPEPAELNEDTKLDREDAASDWAFTICLYVPYDADADARLEEVTHRLSPLQRTKQASTPELAVLEKKPASTETPSPLIHQIGRFVVVAPEAPYCSNADAPDEIVLRLKKTLAFGSGIHPTTVVSLRLIERHIKPSMNGLDLGSGSGILSVAMAKLGAQVLALDNDNVAVQATQDAVQRNQVEHQVTVMEGSLGQGSNLGHWMGGAIIDNVPVVKPAASFDVVVANVFARIHIALVNDYRDALRRTESGMGLLIISGFTVDYEDEIAAALTEAGFETIDREQLDEWVALACQLSA